MIEELDGVLCWSFMGFLYLKMRQCWCVSYDAFVSPIN